jgi:AraC family transcriptional regulator of adaptative response / DNA-3-methyladenine glycosylase II
VTGAVDLLLHCTQPFDGRALIAFLGARAIPGVECYDGKRYRRSMVLEGGQAIVELTPESNGVRCRLQLEDAGDRSAAVVRCRRLLDLDTDSSTVDAHLAGDPVLRPLVKRRPGLRVPSTVDGFELAVRAIVGQQISVAGARTVLGRMAAEHGEPLAAGGRLTRSFPLPSTLATADPALFPFPRVRAEALRSLARLVLEDGLDLDAGAETSALLGIRGVGPWTASYVCMRALGDPDAWLPGDVGLRNALARLGHRTGAAGALGLAEAWRPWRSYAVMHLWASL